MLPGGIEAAGQRGSRRGDIEFIRRGVAFEGEWETGHRTLDVPGEDWCVLGGEVSWSQTMSILRWPEAWDGGHNRSDVMGCKGHSKHMVCPLPPVPGARPSVPCA